MFMERNHLWLPPTGWMPALLFFNDFEAHP
jgi:hypothetical protein